ncbi:patatin-like phospholipase family protein [Aquincola sp. S2]|uniref:Patatin-like phospholipase family protein n=1 Tax=Pseudaquabacterium terrae TaxID=2732868 RepID=A0ABX2E9H9_9BURK|nr:patatin-like phospholipase family protein [Aquabacterium terrae]NRF65664.1 patatin-like phospholipase family protein [Aquabacterium terrae]
MSTGFRSFEQHLSPAPAPKRILSLDGGGLRGMLSLQVLRKIEALLKERVGATCLGDYFDLIAGTSTGAIIAGGLSLGMTVDQIEEHYRALGATVFKRSFWRRGFVSDKFDANKVAAALQGVFGTRTLNCTDFRTGLLVVAKRLDTGSTWVLTNNPRAKYFKPGDDRSTTIPNGEYPLWQVIRASTAAPTFFEPELISIHSPDRPDRRDTTGHFVDGGVSPHNNPSLHALMAVTMGGYEFGWQTGADKLLLVSVGTGKASPTVDISRLAALQGVAALNSLMEDCGDLVEAMLQWLSVSDTARRIDREMGLAGPVLGKTPMLTYQRYNALFDRDWFKSALERDVSDDYLRGMEVMDEPGNLDELKKIGQAIAERQVQAAHFPPVFDKDEPA